ncbi:uncharacterized protein LOC131883466 [Tigriopus californicus]|uniref:uncharacterized protein LOC131883466 n=1 Tax=Tigriopus californicus TaxID=6832 RepID=UPI0027D9FA6A|nr:uncharacterized protein LOC131883466 [Tigriopus californicus]
MSAMAMATPSDRGFRTVFRPASQYFVIDQEKEEQFQEWRKRHIERLKKSANIKARVYEYCSQPRVLDQQRRPQTQNVTKLSPIYNNSDFRLHRRKRLTKTRPKHRSTSHVSKLVDTSSEEGDRTGTSNTLSSGTSLNPSDEGFASLNSSVSSRGAKKAGKASSRGKKGIPPDKLDSVIHELVMEVIEHSMSEVRLEERHIAHLVSSSRA